MQWTKENSEKVETAFLYAMRNSNINNDGVQSSL